MGLSPFPLRGFVLRHDPENDGFWVMTQSAVIPLLVRRRYPIADGLRIIKPPLPVLGSWVHLDAPGGDFRNVYSAGAFHPNLVDCLPDDASDPYSHYESRYDGSWSYHSGSGSVAHQWADNSSLVLSSGSLSLPTLHRHTVTSGQTRQRVVFNQSDRNPNPKPPFGIAYSQTTSGGVGGLNVTITPSGSLSVTSTVSGQSISFSANGCTVTVDASGNADISMAAGKNLVVTQGGASATDFLALVSKLVQNFNIHTHGAGPTPDQQWTNDTVKSTAVKISN